MQISCPHCSSRYEVPAELFAEDSRTVRCAECRDTWEVESPRLHESAGPTVVPLFGPEIVTEARFGRRIGTPRAAPRPHSRAKLAGSLRRARGAAVFAAMSLSVAALMAGVARKEDVVRALPASAPLFAAIGLPVNLRGLALDGLETHVADAAAGGPVLTLEGKILNLRREETTVPRLRFSLRDKTSQEVYSWTAAAPKPRLAAGETVVFRNRLAAPPQDGRDLVVSFADAGGAPR